MLSLMNHYHCRNINSEQNIGLWLEVKLKLSLITKFFLLSNNESTYIPIGIKHRLSNTGAEPLLLIEVQAVLI